MRARVLSMVLIAVTAPVGAGEAPTPEPKLELGVGGIVLNVPDYRGSDRYSRHAYPIPYGAYRTERVQVTRSGLRAKLFDADRVSASLSAAASLAGTDDNPDRAGMPQIDPTFEAGPSLDWLLHDGDGGRLRVRGKVPVRAAMAADGLSFKAIGWVSVPHLQLEYSERRGELDWLYFATLGTAWSSEDYQEYFYGVAPQLADPALNRPAYDARGGYSGVRVNLSTVMRRGPWRLGLFGSYDWMGGATFEDSPLFKTEHSLVAGLYLTCRLYSSGVGETLEGESP